MAGKTQGRASADASSIESSVTGVSVAAIVAGAVAASALSLILLSLSVGLGFAAVSPWSGVSPSAFGVSAAIWLILLQVISSAVGGYIGGRLRTKWATLHGDEVYFRDTAHGFLVWALGAVISASLLGSAATAVIGAGAQAGAGALSTVAREATGAASNFLTPDRTNYFTDVLFRTSTTAPAGAADAREEVGRIIVNGLRTGDVPAPDRTYVAQMVASRTGLSQADAEKRVTETVQQARDAAARAETAAKQAADVARKSAATVSLWLFIAMLTGAFCASFAATVGGRHRDMM